MSIGDLLDRAGARLRRSETLSPSNMAVLNHLREMLHDSEMRGHVLATQQAYQRKLHGDCFEPSKTLDDDENGGMKILYNNIFIGDNAAELALENPDGEDDGGAPEKPPTQEKPQTPAPPQAPQVPQQPIVPPQLPQQPIQPPQPPTQRPNPPEERPQRPARPRPILPYVALAVALSALTSLPFMMYLALRDTDTRNTFRPSNPEQILEIIPPSAARDRK